MNTEIDVPMEDICARYRRLYAGAVYDILDEMGLPNQAFASDLRPLLPEMVVAGPAFTIQGVNDPTADPDLNKRRIQLFKAMRGPCIDVRDCGFDTRVAHYGEMNASLGARYGAVGAVIDGGVRDCRLLLKMDFPVFARYQTPVEAKQRWSYYRWQVPISVRGALTATVTVNPGDFIFGDMDGIVCIPQNITIEVLERAEEMVSREDRARSEYVSEIDPETTYEKFGRL